MVGPIGPAEGPGKPSPMPNTELAELPKRTKAKEECGRLEGPRGAALWRTGTHEPVGEVRGDQTAESRNENRLGPKGQQLSFNPVNTRQAWGFRCRSGDPAEPRGRMGPSPVSFVSDDD